MMISVFLEVLRNKGFWALDQIKGGSVTEYIDEIKSVIECNSGEEKKDFVSNKRKRLIKHAVQSVPFYEKLGNLNYVDFPVINKSTIKKSPNDFISRSFNKDDLIKRVTSGSTGTPFEVFHDENKRIRNTADTIYFAAKGGFTIGQELVYIKVWNDLNRKSKLSRILENVFPVDVKDLSDDRISSIIVELENRSSIKGILGYASAIEQIAKYMAKSSKTYNHLNIKSIITMSESLGIESKKIIKSQFSCPVVSRYSNMENGIIAQQVLGSGEDYLVNTASYFVEILKMEEDIPAGEGELGRIVITDLYNYGMPLIRYDTGDIGSVIENKGSLVFNKIMGRRMDLIYDTKGNLLSSFLITNTMWKYIEVDQYQFIQEGKRKYLFKINCGDRFSREKELISEFKNYLGLDADIKIIHVNEIPLLSSGKRKKVINTYR